MKTKRLEILLLLVEMLLPLLPGLYVVLRRPEVTVLTPGIMVPWMLCFNLLLVVVLWRRLGWTRRERFDNSLLLMMFSIFPWIGSWLPVAELEGNLWGQIGLYCILQAGLYVAIILAPDWFGKFQQQRYEGRVLSGEEKFESRKELMKSLEEQERSSE